MEFELLQDNSKEKINMNNILLNKICMLCSKHVAEFELTPIWHKEKYVKICVDCYLSLKNKILFAKGEENVKNE